MDVTALDVVLVILFVAICVWAVVQRLVRQLMTLAALYVATAVAGLIYPQVARWLSAIGGRTPTLTEGITFWILFLAVTIALEVLLRRWFPDVRLPKISFLDNVLGLLPGILCGLIVMSLLLTSLGYASTHSWGGSSYMRAGVRSAYERAVLQPPLGQFLELYLTAHRFWFPRLPPLLAYALP
jgi:uncharacterized membrane protein required for colicin V production